MCIFMVGPALQRGRRGGQGPVAQAASAAQGGNTLGGGVGGSAVTHVSPVAYISSSHSSEDPALKSVIKASAFTSRKRKGKETCI